MRIREKLQKNLTVIMILYVLGIFMGAIDTGIVTPARTIIQSHLGVLDDKTGIWMITIFTLAYAAAIPIAGKLADKLGRKYVYIISIFLFGLGSLICGLSKFTDTFAILLIGRVIQAIGGGGIMPIASAEFATSFPKEKRGFALGIVGGVYGIANILGATIGSSILNIAGKDNWEWLFFVNLPIATVIIFGGFFILPLHKGETENKKIDFLGIGIIVAMILSLLYGIKGIDFFNFGPTFASTAVWPFLLIFLVLLPMFIFVERRAADPVMNLKYFTKRQILITLLLSLMVGISMMGMVFVPQFAENALKIATGNGGYFVTILGFFAGFGAPFSGRLIDKFGAKRIMGLGFSICIIGSLFLAFVSTQISNPFTVITSLVIIGLGLGFVIGTGLNYMMLDNTDKKESNSALSTLSLVRSIGTTIAPAIMIGFIAQAGLQIQGNIFTVLPTPDTNPKIALYSEIQKDFNDLKKNPEMAKRLQGIDLPTLGGSSSTDFMAQNGGSLPQNLIDKLKSADATNITDVTKQVADQMFGDNVPAIIANIQNGIQTGIDKFAIGSSELLKAEKSLTASYNALIKQKALGIPGLDSAINKMKFGLIGMADAGKKINALNTKMKALKASIPGVFEASKQKYIAEVEALRPKLEDTFQSTLNGGFKNMYLFISITSILALLLLLFYKEKSRKKENLGTN